MNKPWFEKKKFGWGWGLPLRWQGWLTLILFVGFISSLDFITTNMHLFIPLLLAAVLVFCAIAWITSGKPEWSNGEGYTMNKERLLKIIMVVVSMAIIIVISQIIYLHKAHSTFDNYYRFRGCVQLLNKTDTSAQCTLPSGQVITLEQINNKWYLQGDGPGKF